MKYVPYILLVVLLVVIAAVLYEAITHPWWTLAIFVAIQIAGMAWAWHKWGDVAEKLDFNHWLMIVLWPFTAFIAILGRVQ